MKRLTIGKKEYKLEYSIEATLYDECIEKTIDLIGTIADLHTKDMSIKDALKSMASVPKTTLILFYAGLMESHGIEGDESILSISDAKALAKEYFAENEGASWNDILNICMECMEDDGFFAQIGLNFGQEQTEEEKVTKIPQDHKRKSPTKKS